jgi:hypothetical protein
MNDEARHWDFIHHSSFWFRHSTTISPFMTSQWPGKVKGSHGLQPVTAAKK